MKKFKLFASILCAVMMVVLITGCGGAKNEGEKSKGKCEVFECVEKINATGTIAAVNEIIGFDGEITRQSEEGDTYAWKVYKWQLTEETAIEIRHNENLNILSVEAIFPTSMLKKKDIDWSNVKTDMKAINSKDGLKYADVVRILHLQRKIIIPLLMNGMVRVVDHSLQDSVLLLVNVLHIMDYFNKKR